MNEDLLASYWHSLCEQLWALKKDSIWERDYDNFDAYTKDRWSLSKQRTKLLLNFGHFSQMCRQNRKPLPDSPENVQKLLSLRKKVWIDFWQRCLDYLEDGQTVNNKHCEAVLERHYDEFMGRPWRPSEEQRETAKINRAANNLADAKLHLVKKPPKRIEQAVNNAITLDERRMNDE